MRILILHNAVDANRPDSVDVLRQVDEIASSLKKRGHDIIIQAVPNSLDCIQNTADKHKPDVVCNLVESFGGSDKHSGLIPAYLDMLNVPYTGCPASAMFMASNKCLTKQILETANIPVPLSLTESTAEQYDGPWIIKSATEHASLGIDANSVVQTSQQARKLMAEKTKLFGGEWFAEQYIDGREFNISVLGSHKEPTVLPIAEIEFMPSFLDKPRIVDYAEKWPEDEGATNTPRVFPSSRKDSKLLQQLKSLTIQCWKLLNLHGYVRIDFRVDHHGNPYVLEVNTNPCLSSDAGFIAAALQAGMSYDATIDRIISLAQVKTNNGNVLQPQPTSVLT